VEELENRGRLLTPGIAIEDLRYRLIRNGEERSTSWRRILHRARVPWKETCHMDEKLRFIEASP